MTTVPMTDDHDDRVALLLDAVTKLLSVLRPNPTGHIPTLEALRMTRGFALDRTASGDSAPGVQTVQWCFLHERTHRPTDACRMSVLVPVHSDPTGNSAIGDDRDRDTTYPVLLSKIDLITAAAFDLHATVLANRRLTLKEARTLYLKETGTAENRAVPCASVLCDDTADAGSRYCRPCDDWLADHPDSRQVPRVVITERRKKRKQRARTRIHITGPLAEEAEL